ncbi:hypothetical protein [Brachybacterium sp. ACRRE]|uniref:hypothetical protein n=1 Tax=Brachybacterium sp. ACRRE TaxID=2918184 RepID=UPI001EF193D5|nr:hypothetical protein [Brachybacterium sp. ACRRE]MCG7307924.1 hypothetical protein [Brachybacterium sp. ACRRE]
MRTALSILTLCVAGGFLVLVAVLAMQQQSTDRATPTATLHVEVTAVHPGNGGRFGHDPQVSFLDPDGREQTIPAKGPAKKAQVGEEITVYRSGSGFYRSTEKDSASGRWLPWSVLALTAGVIGVGGYGIRKKARADRAARRADPGA